MCPNALGIVIDSSLFSLPQYAYILCGCHCDLHMQRAVTKVWNTCREALTCVVHNYCHVTHTLLFFHCSVRQAVIVSLQTNCRGTTPFIGTLQWSGHSLVSMLWKCVSVVDEVSHSRCRSVFCVAHEAWCSCCGSVVMSGTHTAEVCFLWLKFGVHAVEVCFLQLKFGVHVVEVCFL
jgi:hypothetical protein